MHASSTFYTIDWIFNHLITDDLMRSLLEVLCLTKHRIMMGIDCDYGT